MKDNYKTTTNSDGLINCLLQPGQFYFRIQKSMREEFAQLIKFCCTRTVPAAETKSMGLQADARVVMVFASPSRQFYCDMTNPAHLSGPRHLDSFIVTNKSCPLTGTLQKRMPTLTPLATARGRLRQLIKPPGR
jgi:hypothetical protein